MTAPAYDMISLLLPDGRVFMGTGASAGVSRADLLDPVGLNFSEVLPTYTTRQQSAGALIGTGQVVVLGGFDLGF